MNYIQLMNIFWKLNKEVSFSVYEIALYLKLLDTCNSLGWKNPFGQANGNICGELGMSEPTLIKARLVLKEYGFIEFTPGKKKKHQTGYLMCNEEEIIKKFSKTFSRTFSSEFSSSLSGSDGVSFSGSSEKCLDNNKHKLKTKNNNKSKDLLFSNDDANDFLKIVFEKFNSICTRLPKVTALSDNRKSSVEARLQEHGLEKVMKMLEMAAESDFLAGYNENEWKASFDWIFRPNNFLKVVEGNYANKTGHLWQPHGKPSPITQLEVVTDILMDKYESFRENPRD